MRLQSRQAEEDFGIPSTAWEENPALNRHWIVQHLTEAVEEIQKTIEAVKESHLWRGLLSRSN